MKNLSKVSEMAEKEPKLFKKWDPYMKMRQIMASAAIFKSHGWADWEVGHAKLFGILLWDFETKRKRKFRYCNTLKKHGYQRTHNYRLLNELVEKNVLQKEGGGYYSFVPEELELIKKVVLMIKKLDVIGKEIVTGVEVRSEGIAL